MRNCKSYHSGFLCINVLVVSGCASTVSGYNSECKRLYQFSILKISRTEIINIDGLVRINNSK